MVKGHTILSRKPHTDLVAAKPFIARRRVKTLPFARSRIVVDPDIRELNAYINSHTYNIVYTDENSISDE